MMRSPAPSQDRDPSRSAFPLVPAVRTAALLIIAEAVGVQELRERRPASSFSVTMEGIARSRGILPICPTLSTSVRSRPNPCTVHLPKLTGQRTIPATRARGARKNCQIYPQPYESRAVFSEQTHLIRNTTSRSQTTRGRLYKVLATLSAMKMARYFIEQVLRKRPYIRVEWCEKALRESTRKERQPDGRLRHWVYIPELAEVPSCSDARRR